MFRSVQEFEDTATPTPAERKLIAAVRTGTICWLCDSENPERPEAPTPETRIRAPLLRLLITGGTPDCGLHEWGVNLAGGWIDGQLDLSYCTASGATKMDYCHFSDEPEFYNARIEQLSLEHSQFPGLSAQGVVVRRSVFLRGARSTATVDLNSAEIGGQLVCDGAQFSGQHSQETGQTPALRAEHLRCQGLVGLQGLVAVGTVRLNDATISGQISLIEAEISGGLDKDGKRCKAVSAQGVKTQANIFLRKATFTDTVDFNSAECQGDFDLKDATFTGSNGQQLRFDMARISSRLIMRDASFESGRLTFAGTHVGELMDQASVWPTGTNQLDLEGFTYDRISSTSPQTLAERADWLRTGSSWGDFFTPQPYTQFTRVLRRQGDEAEARKVLIERERLLAEHRQKRDRAAYRQARNGGLRKRSGIWLRMRGAQLWSALTRVVTGYGYAPQRALFASLSIVGLSSLLFMCFWRLGAMVPADAVILTSAEWQQAFARNPLAPALDWPAAGTLAPAGSHYETFYALAFALDVYLPIVDLGQQSTWAATTATWAGWTARLATWAVQTLGYVVTTLGLAAITGVIQRDNPD